MVSVTIKIKTDRPTDRIFFSYPANTHPISLDASLHIVPRGPCLSPTWTVSKLKIHLRLNDQCLKNNKIDRQTNRNVFLTAPTCKGDQPISLNVSQREKGASPQDTSVFAV